MYSLHSCPSCEILRINLSISGNIDSSTLKISKVSLKENRNPAPEYLKGGPETLSFPEIQSYSVLLKTTYCLRPQALGPDYLGLNLDSAN